MAYHISSVWKYVPICGHNCNGCDKLEITSQIFCRVADLTINNGT